MFFGSAQDLNWHKLSILLENDKHADVRAKCVYFTTKFNFTLILTELNCATRYLKIYGIWMFSISALSLHNRQVAAVRLIASLSCFMMSATGPSSVPHDLQIIV